MKEKELKKIVERVTKNKPKSEKLEDIYFDNGFEIYEVDGLCADDNTCDFDITKNVEKLCFVKIGDPIVFEGYFEGKYTHVKQEEEYRKVEVYGDYRELYEKVHDETTYWVFSNGNGKYCAIDIEKVGEIEILVYERQLI